MQNFVFFDESVVHSLVNSRQGESKFGERLTIVSSIKQMQSSAAEYVIFGIPEDIGIRANFGKPGAADAWHSFLSSFLNIQVNEYNDPSKCMILGHIDCAEFMAEAERLTKEELHAERELGGLVSQIDELVSKLVKEIVQADKVPIIIGGGHNNSYGNCKGVSLGLGKPINLMNIDAHTDLRTPDYRHSGNGFSYAKKEGFLSKYAMFGIHKNYTPDYIFKACGADDNIRLRLFEDIIGASLGHQLNDFVEDTEFLDQAYGLEIDCDAIEDFSSSAMTPSGFPIRGIRALLKIAKAHRIHYLHLAEAAPHGNPQIGKALSYFVSDFIGK